MKMGMLPMGITCGDMADLIDENLQAYIEATGAMDRKTIERLAELVGKKQPARSARGKLLTVHQVSKRLGLSEKTITKRAREGILPGQKIGKEWRFPSVKIADLVYRAKKSHSRK